jgi:hypothetical protein
MSRYPHLEGLRRLSPCCHARVAHDTAWASANPLRLICLRCRKGVSRFLLKNRHGQAVWPIEGKLPPTEPATRRKRRRTHPTEPDPEPFTLHLDRHVRDWLLR